MKIVSFLITAAILAGSPGNCHAEKIINVKKFGAKGDGKTDDTRAIQAAINSAKGNTISTIYFPKGVFVVGSYTTTAKYLENYCLLIHSNITFNGTGKNSVIQLAGHILDKPDTSANAHVFYGTSVTNVKFTNLQIDLNGKNNLIPEGFLKNAYGVFIKNGSNVKIKNITVKNCAGRNMLIFTGKGSNLTIEGGTFLNGGFYVGGTVPNKNQNDFSFIYTEWDSSRILNNVIQQQNLEIGLSNYSGGIELHGSFSKAAGNKITGCFPGLYVGSDWHTMEKTSVENNKLYSCVKGVILWVGYPMNNVSIQGNSIQLVESRRIRTDVQAGIEVPHGNDSIYSVKWANNAPLTNLSIKNNTIVSLVADVSDFKTAGMILHSLQKSTISNNIITGMNYSGIIFKGSKWGADSVLVTKNKISGFKYNTDKNSVCSYVMIIDTYSKKENNAPGLKNISVTGNDFLNNSAREKSTIEPASKRKFEGVYVVMPGSMMEQVRVDNNNFPDKTENIKRVKTN